jgi:alanine dehydrogenase
MKIGVIKEIKDRENRVALTPAGARILSGAGHTVLVQAGAGKGSCFADAEYQQAGARIVSLTEAWQADIVLKVKEPLPDEYPHLNQQILFTYLHLAGVAPDLTEALLARSTTAIAYETVEDEHGRLPLLAPMSAVAGNMAVTMGSYYLARFNNGKGVQLGAVLGERSGKVVILGDGVVGQHAAAVACGMGTNVFIAGRHLERAVLLKKKIHTDLTFFLSTPKNIAAYIQDADLVVGAVLRHGARAPHVVSAEMVKAMQPGSVIVDVSIDQGGCIETSEPTSHSAPVFEKHGVIHYCVTNMPGAYPCTSTMALTAATLPYALKLADKGLATLREDSGFAKGVNTHQGFIRRKEIATALDMMDRYKPF